MAVVHYFYDPLCGWCYAAKPLVDALGEMPGLAITLHGGGLWAEPTHLPPAKREMIRGADARIAAMTGQTFGPAYLDGLLPDETTVFYSRPTIAAVLAAQSLDAGKALTMLSAIQRAHYVNGKRVVEEPVLIALATGIGLPEAAFTDALRAVPVDAHIDETRGIMAQLGLGGFPSLILEHEGQLYALPHQQFYGKPDLFRQAIEKQFAFV
ncbi:DsbA family protein [Microvirga terricola]|uniref:DsbA family protein n=1 Tax=Microvirga terricola TaxID=2719797 RepID=A0ABX0V747_9HYPH|nr:DsbA family protein [Microvirga terricola]NIX75668.1 DsbA family protein [Microvirga terricola]